MTGIGPFFCNFQRQEWRAWLDSNQRPLPSEGSTLSPELQALDGIHAGWTIDYRSIAKPTFYNFQTRRPLKIALFPAPVYAQMQTDACGT